MKLTFLNTQGEVVIKQLKDLPTSWETMNMISVDGVTKEEIAFLDKYGLKHTVFNCANLREYGLIHLPKHFVGVVLEHGAIDRRLKHGI